MSDNDQAKIYALVAEMHAHVVRVEAMKADNATRQFREEGMAYYAEEFFAIAEELSVVATALRKIMTNSLKKEELRRWYSDAIGYDPFKDDPTLTVEEVAKVKKEYLELSENDTGGVVCF